MDSNQANDTGRSPWLRPQRAAVTSAKVPKTYRKNLVRFDLCFIVGQATEVQLKTVVSQRRTAICCMTGSGPLLTIVCQALKYLGKRHRKKTEVACKTKTESRRPSSKTSQSLRIRTTPLISQASLHVCSCTIYSILGNKMYLQSYHRLQLPPATAFSAHGVRRKAEFSSQQTTGNHRGCCRR